MADVDCLIISGGWEGHRPRECAEIFVPLLKEAGLRVRQADSLSVLDDGEALKRLKLIVPNWTMGTLTGEQEQNLCDAVAAGVGLGGWHGGMGDAFRSSTNYQFMVGGQFVAHPGNTIEYRVRIKDRDHPITKEFPTDDFAVRSEQYYMHVDPSNRVLATTVLSGDVHPWLAGTVMPAAWVRRWGEGLVFYCSVGHSPEDLASAPVTELVRRGLIWVANTPANKPADAGVALPAKYHDVTATVSSVFQELTPERAARLDGWRHNSEVYERVAEALFANYDDKIAREIAFHMTDWHYDAAFVVALHLFPERFSADEIDAGVQTFLVHAPSHVAAAAKLAGTPIRDVFGLGSLIEEDSSAQNDD